VIKIENIEKSYNGERVLKGVSLEIRDGEFISIMGESGSGKSTLLSILGGFLAPDGGRVVWDGKEIGTLSEKELSALRCDKMGFVFQSYQLIPTLNVNDNLLLPTVLGKKLSEQTKKYVWELIEELEIAPLLKKFPHQLSGGQCQRVAIIRALAYSPSVLILDEPTGALDSRMEKKVMDLLSRINREKKTTVIHVTHSMNVASYGRRIIRLADGEIVACENSEARR
jgi:ABC-type lipoprotein export system ATPase subunit